MKFYYYGTIFSLIDKEEMRVQERKYLIAEYNEEDYVFQVICLTGYETGRVVGYIRKDEKAESQDLIAVSEDHLNECLHEIFDYSEDSLEFISERRG